MREEMYPWWEKQFRKSPELCEALLEIRTIREVIAVQNMAGRELEHWERIEKATVEYKRKGKQNV